METSNLDMVGNCEANNLTKWQIKRLTNKHFYKIKIKYIV